MYDTLSGLYGVIESRKSDPQEGSYTNYLFDKGLDKILKKIGEECAETIVAAKNGEQAAVIGETADLLYHVLVMLSQLGIPWSAVSGELDERSKKIGNLKQMRQTDKTT